MKNSIDDIEKLNIGIDDICKVLKSNFPKADIRKVREAYDFAMAAHKGQMRKTGDPYIVHPLFIAYLTAYIRLDEPAVAAALLHDVVEDTDISLKKIKDIFGEETAFLVDGLTNIRNVSKKVNILGSDFESSRKLLITSTKDVRVILIKLADRLHNILTISGLARVRRKEYAMETLKLFAPLADFVGANVFRKKLEDYSFKEIEPKIYDEINYYLQNNTIEYEGKKIPREDYILKRIEKFQDLLKSNKVRSFVFGRNKGVYSIYRKIVKKYKDYKIDYIKNVNDLIGITILVDSIPECYKTLGIVHSKYNHIQYLFDDYIARPKNNGYRSIHTCLTDSEGLKIALQIKTHKMHEYNEYGPASHIYYKQKSDDAFPGIKIISSQVSFLKKLVRWKEEVQNAENYKVDIFKDKIFVLTPQREVKELPVGSTGLDFAYLIHTNLGNSCKGIKVNGVIRSLNYVLKTGDVIEVLIDKKRIKPSVDWLEFVKTPYAKSNIRKALREDEPEEEEEDEDVEEEVEEIEKPIKKKKEEKKIEKPEKITSSVRIKDIDNIEYSLAKCCSPIQGDDIVAHVTKTRGIKVHLRNCPDLLKQEYKVLLEAEWRTAIKEEFKAKIYIQATGDNAKIMQTITKLFSDLKINIEKFDVWNNDGFNSKIELCVNSKGQLEDLMRKIKKIKNISNVQRIT